MQLFMTATAACALVLGMFALGTVLTNPPPHLRGLGCSGAGGILYANEESDFPNCRIIEPNS